MSDNPLLASLRIPGETFTLPSGGLLYSDNELGPHAKNGELHVYPMTAYDEIILKTPDLLFSGQAAVKVFNNCISAIEQVDRLFVKDVDFLMICLRKVSYGNEYQFDSTHTCEGAKPHIYSIDLGQIIRKTKKLNPTIIKTQRTSTLSNGQVVEVEPLRFAGYIAMSQVTDILEEKLDDPETILNRIVATLASVIVSVDGVCDKAQITEWITKLPVKHHYEIQTAALNILDWGVETKNTIKCKDCGEAFSFNPLLNPINFFSMR